MKKWYRSKTLWFNVITIVVAVATAFLDQRLFTNPTAISVFTAIITVGNILLRVLFTGQPIEGTPPAKKK